MIRNQRSASWAIGVAWMAGTAACLTISAQPPATKINPGTMVRVGTVDERFQSYNIEAVEVTGGRFWKPYASASAPNAGAQPAANAPPGMDPSLYEYRAPIDLSNPRLRKLAAALGPAYVRVSGTWMNSTYFQDSDDPAPPKPPAGFNSVLTRKEWKGVIDFAHAANAQDRDFVCDEHRNARRRRCLDAEGSAGVFRLHEIRRRGYCRCGVYE